MPASPTVRRIYSGTPGNSIVTEITVKDDHGKSQSPQKRYQRSANSAGADSPTQSLRSPAAHKSVSPYVRSPSPQQRYNVPSPGDSLPPGRSSNSLDKSFHQSQKNLRQSHLEEQCSALTYELELAKAANQKMARKAESAVCKADRMDRDHSALVAERDAAIARAEAAEEEYKQFKSGEEYTGLHKMKKDFHDKSDECLDLRSQLAQAVEQRDTAYSQLQQHAGEHLVREHSSHKVKVKTSSFKVKGPSFSMGSSSLGIEVTVKAPSIEVKVKAPGMEIEVEVNAKLSKHQKKDMRESQEHALLKAFEELDVDDTEFAPRLDLRKQVQKFVPKCAEVQQLVEYIMNLDVMIIEKEDYESYVHDWVEGELH